MKVDLKSMTKDELVAWFAVIGQPKFRAHQIMQWLYNQKVTDFAAMSNLTKDLRQHLSESAVITHLEIAAVQQSRDGTRKYLFRLSDGQSVESVFIPDERRNTLCISSQVGCALGCTFCATGKMGFRRNLTAAEIVDQIVGVARDLGDESRISNIVMMGMGEPFQNYTNVVKALRIMIDESALQQGGRKITVSTSGLVHQIRQFAAEGLNIRLAISLNSTTNATRDQLMPVNRKFPIEDLILATKEFFEKTGNRVTFEYVLLKGLTDSLDDAKRLVDLTSGFPCKVNLIPYNSDTITEFQPPSAGQMQKFVDYLLAHHPFAVTLRKPRGEDILAACGQLKIREDA